MSVLLVEHVRVPNGDGTLTAAPLERTVPFVAPVMCWTVRVPLSVLPSFSSTTALPWLQLLQD